MGEEVKEGGGEGGIGELRAWVIEVEVGWKLVVGRERI